MKTLNDFKISHIIAMSENRVIGKDNQLPWHLPADLKFFKEKTKNNIIIMGRKTFDSIKKPLPNRYHVVISRTPPADLKDKVQFIESSNSYLIYVQSLDEALTHVKKVLHEQAENLELTPRWGNEVFIIGGGEIFKQSMNIVDIIYLTVIHKIIDGDVYYPEFDLNLFKLSANTSHQDPMPFSFQTWTRV